MASRRRITALAGAALAGVSCLAVWGTTASAGSESLTKGWNNVAYSGSAKPVAEALSPISGKYAAVYRWNAAGKVYEMYAPNAPAQANTLTTLAEGDAIWVNLTSDTAQLTSASTGVLSIAASTFLPASDLAIYEKKFNQLNPVGTDDASKRYYAALNLPQGATITSMTAAFEAPGSGGQVQVRLDYTALTNADSESGQVYKLAEVLSTGGPSPQTAQAFAHVVDNSTNVYFIVVDLTGGQATKLKGVSVAYTGG